ncbi:MAG: hypothetical protein ABS44_04040 [Chryseobacterium sp. SCN 40-13]|nr:MAG: hypothetical protein ABS44_04040 [Chryseobacterium sp. SCN 40-13]
MVAEIIWKRLYSYLIDMIIISVPMYVYMIVFWDKFITITPGNLLMTALMIQFLPFLVYSFVAEAYFGKTVGKKVMNLKVIAEKNRYKSVLIRSICRLIPLDLITFIFLGDQLLHDYLSNTKVMYQ